MARPHPALSLALLLVTVTLGVVGSATPATSAAAPCVRTFTTSFTAPEGTIGAKPVDQDRWWNIWEIPVSDPRVVSDIDFAIDFSVTDASGLTLYLSSRKAIAPEQLPPTSLTVNGASAPGPLSGTYVFDDEASGPLGAGGAPGRYRPSSPLSRVEGLVASPNTWLVWANNNGPGSGAVRSITVTLTFTTCDSDGDGVDEAVDNCRDTPNPDQANGDDDSVGNACDIDDDNDGTDDVDDPCPVAAGPRGCPAASRTARLAHKVDAKRLVVTVRSTTRQCRSSRVTLHRVRRGKDPRAGSGRTNARGVLQLEVPRKPGTYYAAVASSVVPGVAECRGATTKRVTVRRR